MVKLIAGILFAVVFQTHAQIQLADSSAQVVSYWTKGEKQNYTISLEKIKLAGGDTTSRELTNYIVEVSVLDSAGDSYTMQWLYKSITTTVRDQTLVKILNLSKDLKVIYRTNELGVFAELVNWKEIQSNYQKGIDAIRAEAKGKPEIEAALRQIENSFSSKETIESAAIREIQQFHTFHGAKYVLGEMVEGKLQVPNTFGGTPFDSDFTVYLDEINEADNNYILRAVQTVNKEQLTNATFNFLVEMSKGMNRTPPTREMLGNLENETLTAARIHGSGWIMYSMQTVTVAGDNSINIEERIIEIQ